MQHQQHHQQEEGDKSHHSGDPPAVLFQPALHHQHTCRESDKQATRVMRRYSAEELQDLPHSGSFTLRMAISLRRRRQASVMMGRPQQGDQMAGRS